LKIFFSNFFAFFGSFSTREIVFAIAPRLPFFKSIRESNIQGSFQRCNKILYNIINLTNSRRELT